MSRLVFDIETNGLLHQMDTIHSLVIQDAETGELRSYANTGADQTNYTGIAAGVKRLQEADEIVGHNIIKFDIPAIQLIYPEFEPVGKITDTLVLTRLMWPDIRDSDFARRRKGRLPGNLIGSQGLEAWGYRLGEWKGDYSKVKKDEIRQSFKDRGEKVPKADILNQMVWATWSKDMQDYCEQDVIVTTKLLHRCDKKNYSKESIELEHLTALLCAKIERNGFPFDEKGGAELYVKLLSRRTEIEELLKERFGFWYVSDGTVDPKRTIRYKDPNTIDRIKGQPWTAVRPVQFNPASRDHIANRLTKIYDWQPTEFTPEGKPKVDEEVLSGLPYPEADLLTEYFLLNKRIGQLSEGRQAWLKAVQEGFVTHSINPNGAITGRATHSFFNIAQVPSTKAKFGIECRKLFGLHNGCSILTQWPGATMLGTDKSGLELRCLAHYMAFWDDGAYAEVLLSGDIHWLTVVALGLVPEGTERDEHNPIHGLYRDIAKTFIYGFLYGAGLLKIGRIIYEYALKEETLELGSTIRRKFFKGERQVTEAMMSSVGKKLKANFLARLPALKNLIKMVKRKAQEKGFLIGLDGRQLPVRHHHAALNTLLQSAGAIACKRWIVRLEQRLIEAGYKHGWDGDFAFMAWVHDELQIMSRTQEIADEIGRLSAEVAAEVGEHFKFRCPLDSDYATGQTWADTH